MKILDLDYLEIPKDNPIVEILKGYGGQISTHTNGYLSYITTSGAEIGDDINVASFYVVAPEINRQHQLLTINRENVTFFKIIIWGLSGQPDHYEVEIFNNDYSKLDILIGELISSPLARNILKLFIEQTKLKLELRSNE